MTENAFSGGSLGTEESFGFMRSPGTLREIRVVKKQAAGTDAMSEVGFTVIANVFLQLHPDSLVGTNLLTVRTNGKNPAEGLDLFKRTGEIAVSTFKAGDCNLAMVLDAGNQHAQRSKD